jgi:hypothetical protein
MDSLHLFSLIVLTQRQSSDARSMHWHQPASPWPHGQPSKESRNAGRRVVDMAIWPVGFGKPYDDFLSLALPLDAKLGSAKYSLWAQSCLLLFS